MRASFLINIVCFMSMSLLLFTKTRMSHKKNNLINTVEIVEQLELDCACLAHR